MRRWPEIKSVLPGGKPSLFAVRSQALLEKGEGKKKRTSRRKNRGSFTMSAMIRSWRSSVGWQPYHQAVNNPWKGGRPRRQARTMHSPSW